MGFFNRPARIQAQHFAKVIGVNIKNIFMQQNEVVNQNNDGVQRQNIVDIPVIEFEMHIELDEPVIIFGNTTHLELYINTNLNKQALNNFVNAVSRQRGNFKSHASYINYLNNLRSAYGSIDRALEVERYDLFNWNHLQTVNLLGPIDYERMNHLRIDALQEQLAIANNNSPLPEFTRQYEKPTKLVLRRSPIAQGKKNTKSNGVQIRSRRNVGDDIIPINSDMGAIKEKLSNEKVSFSEIFRESKNESILDNMMGNIDTQHPPLNPEHPRIQADDRQEELLGKLDAGYTFETIPDGKFVVSVPILVADNAIQGDTFQVKCIICSGDRFAPHQILIENVDYTLVRRSRVDLARPSVNASIDSATRFDTVALNISVKVNSEGANTIGPRIDWIDKFQIKRRKVANQNEIQEQ